MKALREGRKTGEQAVKQEGRKASRLGGWHASKQMSQ